MPDKKQAAFGSWASPVTSDMIIASSIGLGEIGGDGTDLYWLGTRPQEDGRTVLVHRSEDRTVSDITRPLPQDGGARFSVRSRVHEYGGGAYLVHSGTVYFSNDADQRLYCQHPGAAPVPITPDPDCPRGLRYADGIMDEVRERSIWVREDHTTGSREPVNALVAIASDGRFPQSLLQSGRDFYAAPRLSPDGRRLAWIEWDHPLMPWIGCELWVGEITADGSVGGKRRVAGSDDESIFQPEWSPKGDLYFISDRSQDGVDGRWWNLYRVCGDALVQTSAIEVVWPLAAEFGRPQWNFRLSTYAFESKERLVCSYIENGIHRLGMVELNTLKGRFDPNTLSRHFFHPRSCGRYLFPRRFAQPRYDDRRG
jgi:hypothetical protein